MSFEDKFSQQISNFERYGTYQYEYDEVGNCVFASSSNDFSQVFLALPLSNFVYNNTKVLEFYDPTFTEFTPQASKQSSPEVVQLQTDLEAEQAKNAALTQQLDDMISTAGADKTGPNSEAIKQVILELRKTLGQGRVDSDFSTDFPYTPFIKETNNQTGETAQTTNTAVSTSTTTTTTQTKVVQSAATSSVSVAPTLVTPVMPMVKTNATTATKDQSQWDREKSSRRQFRGTILGTQVR